MLNHRSPFTHPCSKCHFYGIVGKSARCQHPSARLERVEVERSDKGGCGFIGKHWEAAGK